jgi:hypothetical protein
VKIVSASQRLNSGLSLNCLNSSVSSFINPMMTFPSLAVFGIVPRKFLVAQAPEQLADSIDFWRGMIDGDCCLVPGSLLNLIGGLAFVRQWVKFCGKFGCELTLTEVQNRLFRAVCYGHRARLLTTFLYEDAPIEARLDRKYEIAKFRFPERGLEASVGLERRPGELMRYYMEETIRKKGSSRYQRFLQKGGIRSRPSLRDAFMLLLI